MLETIFSIGAVAFISFLPIVFWAYTFSYIDPELASRKRFILWIFAGIFSVIPVLFFDNFLEIFSLEKINIYGLLNSFNGLDGIIWINFSLGFFLWLIFLGAGIVGAWMQKGKVQWKLFLRNFSIFMAVFFFLSLCFYELNILFQLFPAANTSIEWTSFGGYFFNNLKVVIFFYFIVAISEEASKHFHFLSTWIVSIENVKIGVLYAIFVAMGFSFVENISYLYHTYLTDGISWTLVQVYFFRSTFALITHILCSSVIAYFFTTVYIAQKGTFSWKYLKTLFMGILVAVFLHAVYDISLSIGFGLIMFMYFIGGYLYITSIFYKE